jgi:Methyltransferase domain
LKRNFACPVCDSDSKKLASAVVAPFLSELTEKKSTFSELRECNGCRLVFFTHRYSVEELDRIYTKYRGEEYFKIRHKWEPWFSESDLNAFSNPNSQGVASRNRFLTEFIASAGLSKNDLNSCLDFGGDLGQFIPEWIGGRKILVDPSNAKSKIGDLEIVSNVAEISFKPDLVINSFVLEHLVNVRDSLRDISLIQESGGIIFIQVPMDVFSVSRFHKSKLYLAYLQFLVEHSLLFKLIDFITGVYRMLFKRVLSLGIVKQSEHINYFNLQNLELLLKQNQYNLIASHISEKSKQGKLRFGNISVIAIKE